MTPEQIKRDEEEQARLRAKAEEIRKSYKPHRSEPRLTEGSYREYPGRDVLESAGGAHLLHLYVFSDRKRACKVWLSPMEMVYVDAQGDSVRVPLHQPEIIEKLDRAIAQFNESVEEGKRLR